MRIFLVRHGFSKGNEDPGHYITAGDPHVELTDKGWEQAIAAGGFLSGYLKKHPGAGTRPLRLWMSSYDRCRQTAAGIVYGAGGTIDEKNCKVSSQIVEQDLGIFSRLQDVKDRKTKMPLEAEFYYAAKQRDKYYARPPQGESPHDVQARRAAPFIGKIMRDRDKGIDDVVIVSHGNMIKALAMEFLKIDPQRYEDFETPENASIYMIEGDSARGYTFNQIYNGETMKSAAIDWGARLGISKTSLPPVPERFKKKPQP
jgi:2,3-bisphosphoglycerate-dependent phosphoglycerate mutase